MVLIRTVCSRCWGKLMEEQHILRAIRMGSVLQMKIAVI